ncbi:hypothetical protein FRC07_000892 [Ceratobasidium sp. 392]|nr:hypothetical protein FRC07_000892 [Ceratobasidium sp. 392]
MDEYIQRFDEHEVELLGVNMAISILEQGVLMISGNSTLRPILLSQLSNLYYGRFQFQEEPKDIDMAISSKNQAVTLTSDYYVSTQVEWLSDLSILYQTRFRSEQNLSDMDAAINHATRAVTLLGEDYSKNFIKLNNLANLHHVRFQHQGDLTDVYTAIHLLHQVAKHASADDPGRHLWSRNLATLHGLRFQYQHNQIDIDLAIHFQTQAISLISDEDTTKAECFNKLAKFYANRFEYLDNSLDIDTAIEYHSQALSIAPMEHPARPVWLIDLGISHNNRFRRRGDIIDINKAIEIQAEALSLVREGDPSKPGCMCNLGIAHGIRFQRLGDVADINAAISFQTQALVHTPPEHAEGRQNILRNLGTSHNLRFQCLGDPTDSETAIKFLTQAVAFLRQNNSDRGSDLNGLASAYLARFKHQGTIADLDIAMTLLNESVSVTPDGDFNKPGRIDNLGIAYSLRFNRLGNLEDLNRAVELQVEAVTLTPEKHANKPERLNNMGGTYIIRYQHTGNIADADSAIACLLQAVSLTPDGHADAPLWLSTLGAAYTYRFRRQGDIIDIDTAIEYHEKSLALTPDLHPERPTRLNSLGTSYINRFQHLGDLKDINQAINYITQAVSFTPVGHPDRAIWLNNLGVTYRNRFQVLNDPVDIDIAIELQTQAVSAASEGAPDKASWLYNLGNFYHLRFERLASIKDLDQAIEFQTRAIQLLPDTDANKASWLNHLGMKHKTRFENQGEHTDVKISMDRFKTAANMASGHASSRLSAARNWGRAISAYESPLEAYELMMSLIPRVVWLGNSVGYRWQYAAPTSRMVTEAATAAIDHQRYNLALEWLEAGRSIIWNQMLQLRNPLQDLHLAYADVAEELHELARDIDRSGSMQLYDTAGLKEGPSSEQISRRHRRMAADWDRLLDQARELPGFEELLKPKRIVELAQAAHSSTIVVLIVYDDRCSALVLCPETISATYIPLPYLTHHECTEMKSQLFDSLNSSGLRGADRRPIFQKTNSGDYFKDILASLWTKVVQPVLNGLGFLNAPLATQLPHVTWCPTGPLVFLPLHAAGIYEEPQVRVFDHVISSYTPTLGALLKPKPDSSRFGGILAVGQAETLGCSPLPGTVAELDRIQNQAKDIHFKRFEGENATPATVLEGMRGHSWVHLACHASQDTSDPTTSGFHLHGGQLDLATIIQEPLENAELAFLSACQTATGDDRLPDEAVHLAAGMIMAGYRTVIATMWSIKDEDAPTVAGQFYKLLLQDRVSDSDKAARALHNAVRHLRDKVGEKEFIRWVPYIHMGN